jgi:phosphoribosyl-ATP pyrophosphohydrolase / phosphoribosyl-AMP cyclohydrolase / histidinol dehydrogenase
MASPILVSFNPSSPISDGLTLRQISYFGRVLIKAENGSQASEFIRANFPLLDVYVDVTALSSTAEIVNILNDGAAKVFVSLSQLSALSSERKVPSNRLVVQITSDGDVQDLRTWFDDVNERKDIGVCVQPGKTELVIETLDLDPESQSIFTQSTTTEDAMKQNAVRGVISIIYSRHLTMDVKSNTDKIPAGNAITARAVTDPATGLIATSVTDERGVSLGLVWSNGESIAEALRTGTGVYHSRKRGLWYKGQSSGDVQELVRIGLDCDGDCLVFVVRQKGRGDPPMLLHDDYYQPCITSNTSISLFQVSAT